MKVIENVCLDVYVLFLLQSLDEVFDIPNIKTGMSRGPRHKGWYLQHGTVGIYNDYVTKLSRSCRELKSDLPHQQAIALERASLGSVCGGEEFLQRLGCEGTEGGGGGNTEWEGRGRD